MINILQNIHRNYFESNVENYNNNFFQKQVNKKTNKNEINYEKKIKLSLKQNKIIK